LTELTLDSRVAELERQVQDLQTALVTNRVTATAVGLVMAEYRMDREQAFHALVRASQQRNIKLSAVALDLVKQAECRH
jgi:AmiR/NasT family two-component response regulator